MLDGVLGYAVESGGEAADESNDSDNGGVCRCRSARIRRPRGIRMAAVVLRMVRFGTHISSYLLVRLCSRHIYASHRGVAHAERAHLIVSKVLLLDRWSCEADVAVVVLYGRQVICIERHVHTRHTGVDGRRWVCRIGRVFRDWYRSVGEWWRRS